MRQINNEILRLASKLKFRVSDHAPGDIHSVLGQGTELCVWSGASDFTIFGDSRVNWAFRALHDQIHKTTGLGFTPIEEMELGRVQASRFDGLLSDLIYIEVAGQAEHYLKTGAFVSDQVTFTVNELQNKGWLL